MALTAAVNLGDKQIAKKHPEALTAKTYTRRSLLKLGVFGAGMAATGALLGRYGPSVSVPKALNDSVLNTIIRIAKREKSDQASIDGRTALLIEKGITAALYLRESDVTVVAGTAHTHNQDSLLTSPQARADAIGKYATLLLKIVDGASDKAGFDEETKLRASGILLDNVMYGQILRVANPPTSKVSPDKVDETLDNAIKFQSDFMVSSNPILTTKIQEIRGRAPQVFGPFGG